jgi:hypothetical protein
MFLSKMPGETDRAFDHEFLGQGPRRAQNMLKEFDIANKVFAVLNVGVMWPKVR